MSYKAFLELIRYFFFHTEYLICIKPSSPLPLEALSLNLDSTSTIPMIILVGIFFSLHLLVIDNAILDALSVSIL